MRYALLIPMLALVGCAGPGTEQADAGGAGGFGGGLERCDPGVKRCNGNAFQVCTQGGAWSLPQNCGARRCEDGVCVSACEGSCMINTTRCAPEGQQSCVADTDGCGVWSTPAPCAEGERCQAGACTPAAQECTPGDRRCVGPAAYAECGGIEQPAWQQAVDCLEGQQCSGGNCVDGNVECMDQCRQGEVLCLGEQQSQTCVRQANGCLDYTAPTDCGAGRRCADGRGCVLACGEPECTLNATRCFQGGRQTCVTDVEGCVVWGAIETCPEGERCEGGECVEACVSECAVDERRCVELGVQYCERVADCDRWGRVEACPGGQQCRGDGVCGVCDDGESETRPCGRCGTQERRCLDGVWQDWRLCMDQGECEAGQVEACGRCGQRTCTAQCTWTSCDGQGVCTPGEESARGTCNQCGWSVCMANCQWDPNCRRSGSDWQRCNDCGWQFCCPDANWCPCAAHFPASCPGQSCEEPGVCR
ncbi:MAG: hypothetical protein KC620_17150 [Myxococcales bacterium]|nr:hypothetical protein [Myxococcales bacterium]